VKSNSRRKKVLYFLLAAAIGISLCFVALSAVLDRLPQNQNSLTINPVREKLSDSTISRILFESKLISDSEHWTEKYWVESELDAVSDVYFIDSTDGFWFVYKPIDNLGKFRTLLSDIETRFIMSKPITESKFFYSGVEILVKDMSGDFYRWADLHLEGGERSRVLENLNSLIVGTKVKQVALLRIPLPG